MFCTFFSMLYVILCKNRAILYQELDSSLMINILGTEELSERLLVYFVKVLALEFNFERATCFAHCQRGHFMPWNYSGADQRKHQSSASLVFVRGIHRWPVNCPHKWPVTRKNVSIWWRHYGYNGNNQPLSAKFPDDSKHFSLTWVFKFVQRLLASPNPVQVGKMSSSWHVVKQVVIGEPVSVPATGLLLWNEGNILFSWIDFLHTFHLDSNA